MFGSMFRSMFRTSTSNLDGPVKACPPLGDVRDADGKMPVNRDLAE
jgi:hypothetical protein